MDDTLLKKRIIELAERTYRTGVPSFTPFLGLAEQDVFRRVEKEIIYVPHALFGGAAGCERVMARFGDESLCGYDAPFPISCIKAVPLSKRFADDLSHRDMLGAIMNLGINRSTIGDIIMRKNTAYIFCTNGIAPHITDNLLRAKQTDLHCELVCDLPQGELFNLAPLTINAASERLDCITAQFLKRSRSDVSDIIRQRKLFVNGKICETAGRTLNTGDVVSIRGYGRFIFRETIRETKKGRLVIIIDKYV